MMRKVNGIHRHFFRHIIYIYIYRDGYVLFKRLLVILVIRVSTNSIGFSVDVKEMLSILRDAKGEHLTRNLVPGK